MQFTAKTPQLTTCPQCDNIVRVDAEFCNICGKRLQPATQNLSESQFDGEEYELEEELSSAISIDTPLAAPSTSEILHFLQQLQEQSGEIERYFPAELPGKTQKLVAWKKQIQRARACAELLERPQLQQVEPPQMLKLRHHLAEATRALDFTREYTIKLVGHAGAGKSTLLAALLGQDIFPRMAGGAVTGVRTRVRLCREDEPEELHVHFLSRPVFESLIKRTEESLATAPNLRQREAYEAEYAILLKAQKAFTDPYLTGDAAHLEIIPRAAWKTESSRYIEEPARDSQDPRLVRLIDYVEYRVHAGPGALLPAGSVLVDLPGGSAGQVRHDAILREELNHVDALLLVIGNNRFGDDDRTQRILSLINQRIVQKRAPEVASQMIFVAVTHWDEITSAASHDKALGSLRPLLNEVPSNYSSFHHHGPNSNYFFYPVRALDALLATQGVDKQGLDPDRQQEGRDYAGRILSTYPQLLKLDPSLPATATAQEYQKVTQKQHEAMLRFSGLPELTADLQHFLTSNRYEVQIRQAETQLAMALQMLEDLCWEQLGYQDIHSTDLQELQSEMGLRQSKRGATRFEQLQRRTEAMHSAWQDALKQLDAAISSENNAYHQALEIAHDRAARRIKIRIMQGHFDHFIKVGNHSQEDSSAMEIGERWTDIDGWGLIKDLRVSFSSALERELNEPARSLAEAFLIPIAHKEEIDGSLDISRVALGEYGGELDEIQKSYNKLKRMVREKSRDVCLYVTMGELLNEEKYAPTKEDPAVAALYRLITATGKADEVIQQARQLMGPILDVICDGLAQSTEQRIAHLFRYELDKLEIRQVYDSDRLDMPPTRQPGVFADLTNRLYSLLTERVLTSDLLRQQLDDLQSQREANVDRWVDLIQDVELLKTVHRQE